MSISNLYINEFVALSKCLPTFLDIVECEDNVSASKRSKLATGIMARMEKLLGVEVPEDSSADTVKPKKPTASTKTARPGDLPDANHNQGPPLHVGGTRVVGEDDKIAGECMLVAERVGQALLRLADDATPDACPGVMVDVLGDGIIQAYIIPDTVTNTEPPRLNMFRFRIELAETA